MNQAIKGGKESILGLQKLFVDSDIYYDPQAFILSPKNVIEISKEIVSGDRKKYTEGEVKDAIILTKAFQDIKYELFDLEEDPGEFVNLWDEPDHKDLKLKLLHNHLDAIMATSSAGIERIHRF
jgi:hypothetical protein